MCLFNRLVSPVDLEQKPILTCLRQSNAADGHACGSQEAMRKRFATLLRLCFYHEQIYIHTITLETPCHTRENTVCETKAEYDENVFRIAEAGNRE